MLITIGLGTGLSSFSEQVGNDVFLSNDGEVAKASATLSTEFLDSAGLSNVTILHRGDAYTLHGLTQIDEVMTTVITIPEVAKHLALTEPTVSVAAICKQVLGVSYCDGVANAFATEET